MAQPSPYLGECKHVCGRRRGSQERNGRNREKDRRVEESCQDGAGLAKRWATATLGLP